MSDALPRRRSISAEYAYADVGVGRGAPPHLRWPTRILAVESTALLSRGDQDDLLHHGIELCVYADGLSALLGLHEEQPTAIIAPTDITGVDLAAFIRAVTAWAHIPIIVGLGPEPDAHERAFRALECGARSLLPLPFTATELSKALRMLGQAPAGVGESAASITIGPLTVDPQAFNATVDGVAVRLTPRELQVLRYLMTQSHRVVSVQELAEQHGVFSDATVDGTRVTVLRIRRKLDSARPRSSALIQTFRGIGYRAVAPESGPDGNG